MKGLLKPGQVLKTAHGEKAEIVSVDDRDVSYTLPPLGPMPSVIKSSRIVVEDLLISGRWELFPAQVGFTQAREGIWALIQDGSLEKEEGYDALREILRGKVRVKDA